jgi:H/ACA ribonucleoprotein complex subunit 4
MIDLNQIKKLKSTEELLEFSIVNIDKPSGPTSFQTDMILKNSLNLRKTSHYGTLDPMVTGVLPIALNRACKLMNYFIGKKKSYVGIMRVHKEMQIQEINEIIKFFLGKITQMPPVKSRVKRQEREREIYSFKILEKKEKDFIFESEVQAGTYIRKLIHDLGEKIGGAHMLELRRTKASIFSEDTSYNVFEFLEAVEKYKKGDDKTLRDMLLPGEIVSNVMPVVQTKKEFEKKLYHGSPLFIEYINEKEKPELDKDERFALFSGKKFIGVYSKINHQNVLGKSEFVLQPIK